MSESDTTQRRPPPRRVPAGGGNSSSSEPGSLFAQNLVRDRVRSFANSQPLTTGFLGVSAIAHSLALVGIVPLRSLSFHPRLALSPAFQLNRIPTSVLVLGRSIPQIVSSVVSLVTWHAQLEVLTCGTGDVIKDGRIVRRGTNRASRKSLYDWLVRENAFFRIQLATLAVVTALEMALYSDPRDPSAALFLSGSSVLTKSSSAILVFPYSLFPVFDASIRWTWAFMELEKDTLIFGVLPVRPIYVPLVTSLMGGASFYNLFKGFLVATAVSAALKLKRGGIDLAFDDDATHPSGELVVDYLREFAFGWYRWIKTVGRKLLNIQSSASEAIKNGASSTQAVLAAAEAETGFDVNDAATFFDATLIPAIGPFVAEARNALVRAANDLVEAGSDGNRPRAGSSSPGVIGIMKRKKTAASGKRVMIEEEVVEMDDASGYDVVRPSSTSTASSTS
ncbi:hypothetical protein HDU84_002364 [Entophlyctis sp. JEL0112]|nr:hypothetical protein HDU84_002364 [Entophlyctis sp. JEL0112]